MRVFGGQRATENEINDHMKQLDVKEFAALTIEARWELVRKSLTLLLSIALKRMAQ